MPDLNSRRTQLTSIFWSFISIHLICSLVRSTFSYETIIRECPAAEIAETYGNICDCPRGSRRPSYEKYNRDQIIKEEVHDIELELSRSDQQIKIQDSDLNRENSRSDQQIKVKDAGVQRKIDMLSAEAKSYLVRKTADNQKLLIKTMGKTAIEVARANSKKSPPVYNYNVIK